MLAPAVNICCWRLLLVTWYPGRRGEDAAWMSEEGWEVELWYSGGNVGGIRPVVLALDASSVRPAPLSIICVRVSKASLIVLSLSLNVVLIAAVTGDLKAS